MAQPIAPISFDISPIEGVGLGPQVQGPQPVSGVPDTFGGLLTQTLGQVNTMSHSADQAIMDWRLGKIENFHEVTSALSRANLAMQFLVQVRNRAVEAYQEVMRMQL